MSKSTRKDSGGRGKKTHQLRPRRLTNVDRSSGSIIRDRLESTAHSDRRSELW
jgi:hypothetical protein